MVLEETLESPLDRKEIQPVHSEGDQSWVFFGRTDAEAETPILWPPHVKIGRASCRERVSDFIFWGSKITADGDCSHEIKRRLLLGRKVMPNLDRILKSRDITLPTKVCLVKTMVFPVVMYGCESWTLKKAECQRIDAFELWC